MNVRNPRIISNTIIHHPSTENKSNPNLPFQFNHLNIKLSQRRRKKHNQTTLIVNNTNKINKNLNNLVYTIYEEQINTSSPHTYTNTDNMQMLALAYFKKTHRTYQENHVLISYLLNLSPFNQIISESAGKEGEDIIRTLSYSLKYEYTKKNNLVFRYGDLCDKFYLILQGQVDMIVPNEEEVELNEFEYYDYLLKLREYKEMNLLKQVIAKNNAIFNFSEKSFDIWVKKAYNTIKVLRYGIRLKTLFELSRRKSNIERKTTPPHRRRENFDISIDKQEKSKRDRRQSMMNMFSANYTFMQDDNNDNYDDYGSNNNKINKNNSETEEIYVIFDSLSKRNLALKLEHQILRTINIIEPKLRNEQDFFPYFDTIDFDKISNEINNLTTEFYLKRSKPIKISSDSSIRKPVTIITYFKANSLKTGDTFGEMISDVNQNNVNQRVVSVIASDNCHFGTLNRSAYNKCLKTVNEKARKAKLNFFFKLDLFKTCDRNLFTKSFYNLFTKRTMTNPQVLFNQHQKTDKTNRSIYFIRDGEFASTCNISINEIHKLLIKLHYNKFISIEDEIETESFKQKKINSIVLDERRQELFDTKNKVKLQFLKENDVIGLDDCLFDNKYLYECKCSSTSATIYEIHINYFKMMLSMDPRIKERVKIQENIKRNLMIKMLLKFKRTRIEVFNYYETNPTTKNKNYKKIKNKVGSSTDRQISVDKKEKSKTVQRFSPSNYISINTNNNNTDTSSKSLRSRKIIISKAISDSFKLLKKREESSYYNSTSLNPQSQLLSKTNLCDSNLLRNKYEISNTYTNSRTLSTYKTRKKSNQLKPTFPSLKKNPLIKLKVQSQNILQPAKNDNVVINKELIPKTVRNRSRNIDVWPLYSMTQPNNCKSESNEEEAKEIQNYARHTINNNNNKLLLPCKPTIYLSSKKTRLLLDSLPGFFQSNTSQPISIFNITNKGMFMSSCKSNNK